MKRVALVSAIFFVLLVCAGPVRAGGLPPENLPLLSMEGRTFCLGTNLHADEGFAKISSVNYQKGALIPWGTRFRVERILRNRMMVTDLGNGRTYKYEFHHNTRHAVGLRKHVDRIFLPLSACDRLAARVKRMSDIDQDGIYQGRALPGMSREGVIIAMGYPPEFANRGDIMKLRSWQYWRGRFDRMEVVFDRRGRVAEVRD